MLPIPPIWHAVPPEVHSTLLNVGGTPEGIAAAGTSWAELAGQYAGAIGELQGILSYIKANYEGPSAEQFIAAHQPMLGWFSAVFAKATEAAAAHSVITAGYGTAVATMPTMPELVQNHVTHGVLEATNFFGVNAIPIGMNEADYVRMWIQAGDVMGIWDGVSTSAVDTIVETPASPITLIPGVGETGSISATAASFLTQGEATAGGASLTGADMLSNTLLVKKAASSPASVADKLPGRQTSTEGAAQQQDQLQQGTQNAASGFMQQASSLASSAPQAASSAIQGPAQMITQAPQTLAQAPQTLGGMLTQFAGSGGSGMGSPAGGAMPVGFPGTGAINGFNPAGMTSLAGGAFGSGPSRPLMPSTWGSAPSTTTAELANSSRGLAPMATGLPGASGSGSGAGGAGMMGAGANRRKGSSDKVSTFTDDAVDEDSDADSDGGTFAMAR
ncbi:PPE domain-containing protein [Mycobacterium sp. NPDC049093]